jgi:uncharacterized lipoprotein
MSWKALLMALCLVLATVGCSVEQTEEGRMPDIDVDVEEGNMPKYDVDAPDVDVEMEDREISVPDIDIDVEKRTVPVPDIDVHPADDKENDDPSS